MVRNQFLIMVAFFIGLSIGGCAGVQPVELEPGTGDIYCPDRGSLVLGAIYDGRELQCFQ